MTPSLDSERCETCRFWVSLPRHESVCRRLPPMPSTAPWSRIEGDRADAVWPRTDNDDWCGEYQQRES